MEEKTNVDFRYSSKGIVSFLLIISLVFTIIGGIFSKIKIVDVATENIATSFRSEIYNGIDNSINGNYKSGFFNYAIRYVYTTNYEFTEDYHYYIKEKEGKENFYNDILKDTPDYNKDGTIDEMEIERYRKEYFKEDKVFEAPENKVEYSTNISGIPTNKNPQNINIKENTIVVKGFYDKGNISFQSVGKAYTDEDAKFENIIKSIIRDYFKHNLDPKIQKINFNYYVDKNNINFTKLTTEGKFNLNTLYNYLIALIISWFITSVVATSSRLNRQREVLFIKGISRIPFEIALILSGVATIPVLFLGSVGQQLFQTRMSSVYIFFVMYIIAVSISLFLYYIIYAIKSFFDKGLSSDIYKFSIIGRLNKLIIKIIERGKIGIENMIGDIGQITTTKLVGTFLALYLLTFIFLGYFDRGITLILMYVILFPILFMLIKSVIKSFKRLNKDSSEIAKGNYDYKVELDKPYFNTIADNFNTIGDNLNTAIESAVKSERLKSELITNVSHDLKTPLTSIINYSGLLDNDNISDEEKKEYIKIINEKSLKLKRLIEDLFEVSKVTSNNIELNFENINFSSLLVQVIGEWEDKLDEKGLKVVTNIENDIINLQLDPNRFYRVLDNIFSNINKYAMDNSRVYVDLSETETEAILKIKNISKYELNISPEELMERFTRGDKSRNTEGSGLGLSIASSLVEAHNGGFKISIDGDLFKTEIKLKK